MVEIPVEIKGLHFEGKQDLFFSGEKAWLIINI